MNIANYKIIVFIVVNFLNILNINAEEYLGPTSLSHKSFSELKIIGDTDLRVVTADDMFITGPISFNVLTARNAEIIGDVKGKHGKFENFQLTGFAELKECKINNANITGALKANGLKIKEELVIIGELEVKNSDINNLTITSDAIYFKNSSCGKIIIKKNSSDKDKIQVLELINTVVNGDIIFESKNGKIIADKSSKFKGRVIGSTTISKTPKARN